jgi:hypothetical protein
MKDRSAQHCLALGLAAAAFVFGYAQAQVTQSSIFYQLYYNQDGYEVDTILSGAFTTPLFVVANGADLDSVSLTIPGSLSDVELTKQDNSFYLSDIADSEEEMLADFPAGEYLFWGEGGTLGSVVYSLYRPETPLWSYELPTFTPETYDATRQIDPNSDFTFEFNTWDSDTEANFRSGRLYIYGYFGDEDFFYAASFSNWDTQHTVPAGTLPPGRHLVAQLYFSSEVSQAVDSVYTFVSYERATAMQVYTSEGTSPCVGDLNFDGLVDDNDFVDFVFAYNILDCADPSMPMDCPADFNFDGVVDDSDFVEFVLAYSELLCP